MGEIETRKGEAIPARATGLGKVLLTYKDIDYIDTYYRDTLEVFTGKTIKS